MLLDEAVPSRACLDHWDALKCIRLDLIAKDGDQMVRLFFNIWPFVEIKICPAT